MKKPKPEILRRYTNLAATIHLLRSRTITLLNPGSWDDRNDAYFMAEYKRRKNLKTLLALCFANCDETYHHWRVFSHGTDGVRIEFDRKKLLKAFADHESITARDVHYKTLKQLDDNSRFQIDDLPFLKRQAFKDESEFRVIYENAKAVETIKSFEIDVGAIRRITLSPWIVKSLSTSVIDSLRQIDGCKGLKVYRSTLVDSERWQSLASNAT
jgi:Protein of unknown function (DUF2971)